MGMVKPFFLGFVIVSIGCHVGLRTKGAHRGRPRDDQCRRRRIGDSALLDFFITRMMITLLY